MIDGPTTVGRILAMGHPDLTAATLYSRTSSESFDPYTWQAIEQPTNKTFAMGGGVYDTNETANFQLLREAQSVLPKVGDRLSIIDETWNIKSVRPRLQQYVFDVFCVRDAS